MSLPRPSLSVGLLLVPDFTMLALAAFVDTLRLAADEGDRSRPIHCRWTVMSDGAQPVRASNGVVVTPDTGLVDPGEIDYLVVVGGTLHRNLEISEAMRAYLSAAAGKVPLIGICTGGIVLARAGLMVGRRCCVSWFHKTEVEAEFPDLEVVADRLFVVDRDRITCAGGTSVIHLASHLVDKHCGAGWSAKGLRIMLEDRARDASAPQPPPTIPGLDAVLDPRVRRAMLLVERRLGGAINIAALAGEVGMTTRQLRRLFLAETGLSPRSFADRLRLERAHQRLLGTPLRITQIALAYGFADAAHFSRRYRATFGMSPRTARATAARPM